MPAKRGREFIEIAKTKPGNLSFAHGEAIGQLTGVMKNRTIKGIC